MSKSGAHSSDSTMLMFPAIIVSSRPVIQEDDPPGENLFPRLYGWQATESPQVMTARWVSVYELWAGCLNLPDLLASWATNVSERYYPYATIKCLAVPNGTPITICYGVPKKMEPNPPDCYHPSPTPGLACAPPTGVWFSYWRDPLSIICNV